MDRDGDLEARVADLYAALRRPRPVVLLARGPADHARLTHAAARGRFGGFAFFLLAMAALLSAVHLGVALLPGRGGAPGRWAPLGCGLLLAATLAWLSLLPTGGRATFPWLRALPAAALPVGGGLAGLATGLALGADPARGLGFGVLAGAGLWLWLGAARVVLGPVWDRLRLRRQRGMRPPLLGAVPLREVVEERLRHAAEGLQPRPGTSPVPPEPAAAEREAARRVRLLLERPASYEPSPLELRPNLGRGAEGVWPLDRLRRLAGSPELPVLAGRALALDRAAVAVTLLEGCAVVLPPAGAEAPHRNAVTPAAVLDGLLAPPWLAWLAGRLPGGAGLWLAAWALDREPDPALRQEGAERLGPAAVLAALGRAPVAEDGTGALFSLGPEPEPTLFVRVADKILGPDGLPRVHWLPVPPHVASAREAVAWTFGRPAVAYAPELET